MIVKITKTNEKAQLPVYQTTGAAGMDIHACLDAPITLKPMERQRVSTGIAIELPFGYEAQIRSRSSMGFKYGVTMVNGVGTIDCDYRGEIGVALINLSTKDFVINHGDRIAQMIIARYQQIDWQLVNSLDTTDRGDGGFGSTGK
jgi:dUTP pyrophosphatase